MKEVNINLEQQIPNNREVQIGERQSRANTPESERETGANLLKIKECHGCRSKDYKIKD